MNVKIYCVVPSRLFVRTLSSTVCNSNMNLFSAFFLFLRNVITTPIPTPTTITSVAARTLMTKTRWFVSSIYLSTPICSLNLPTFTYRNDTYII